MSEEGTIQQRREKIEELAQLGVDAFGRKFETSSQALQCHEAYEEKKIVALAGRVLALRGHGKTIFGNIADESGTIQIYVKKDSLGEEPFAIFKKVNLGDIIGLEGELFKTKTGEVTIWVKSFVFLGKALRPLPEKWHGLKDVETRFRQRYLDLISNPEVKGLFQKRTRIISGIRHFLDERKFMEVETPMMHHISGGAVAKPFMTHHESLDIDLYLRIAPELFLKRLLVGGFEKIYEINRNFRNEGLSRFHNPEFSMLELYSAYDDYHDMMQITEDLVHHLCEKILKDHTFIRPESGHEIKLNGSWARVSFYNILQEHTGVDWKNVAEPKKIILEKGWMNSIPDDYSDIDAINEVFDKQVQHLLIQPTFVMDYPTELCPLTKTKADDEKIAERFELFMAGMEIANAYSELNDPIEQRRRFELQAKEQDKMVDEEFLTALEYGMPCAGGLGIGIDRLVMVLTNAPSIREVILFPQLRPE